MDKEAKTITAPYESTAKKVGKEQEIFSNYLLKNPDINFEKTSQKRIQINYQNLEKYCPQYSMKDKTEALKNN